MVWGKRTWFLAIAALLAGLWLSTASMFAPMTLSGEAGRPDSASPAPRLHDYTGTAKCSARACHGGIEPSHGDVYRNEYTTWLTRDRHEKAYRVLLTDERSCQMAEYLQLGKPAYEAERCLACHSTPQSPYEEQSHLERSGVGCESCHGSAADWLGPHTLPGWREKPDEEKINLGMRPTRPLLTRGQACVDCHVGSATADVDHDLIAAGHPRLFFELGVFMAHMPKHWNEQLEKKTCPDLEARLWVFGQAASAEAALKLLASRAATKKGRPWPEFAEHDCYACHHDLQQPSWRQADYLKQRESLHDGAPRPGSLIWSRWYFAMPHVLVSQPGPESEGAIRAALNELDHSMRTPTRNRQQIADEAAAAAELFRNWARNLDGRKLDRVRYDREALHRLIATLLRDNEQLAATSWDGAEQLYLALAALYDADCNSRARQTLQGLNTLLAFPTAPPDRADSPVRFRDKNFNKKFHELINQLRE
jgi:hypothetical protein